MGIMWHKQVTKNKACGSHVGGTWGRLKMGSVHSKEEGHNDVKVKDQILEVSDINILRKISNLDAKTYKQASNS